MFVSVGMLCNAYNKCHVNIVIFSELKGPCIDTCLCINPVTSTYTTPLEDKYYIMDITTSFAKDELGLVLIALQGLSFSEGVHKLFFLV